MINVKMIINLIKTYGFSWLVLVLFVVICVVAGYIVFPAIVLTHTWNFIVTAAKILHTINIFQGILLWGIIAITLYITTNEKFKLSYGEGRINYKNGVKQIIKEARKKGIPLKTQKPRRRKRKH